MRMPPDDGERFGDAAVGGGVHDESVHLLAQTFFKVSDLVSLNPTTISKQTKWNTVHY